MKKLILLLMFLIPVSIFSEYIYDEITINSVKIEDSEFVIDTTELEPLNFINAPLGKQFFEDNSKIIISYTFNNTNTDLFNYDFELKYNGDRIDYSESSSTTLSFYLSDIFETMPVSDSETFKIDLVLNYDTTLTTDQSKTISFTFHYDTIAPDKAENLKLTSGDQNIKVSWDYSDDLDVADVDKVMVFYKKTDSTDDYTEKTATGSSTEYQIKDLENEVDYSVYVTIFDLAGNESEKTDDLTAIPVPVDDFYKYYRKSGGKEDGGYCFIATAAYGSYDDGMVKILRTFRDGYLPESFIKTYYKYSPPIANIIAKSTILSFVTRILLEPFVLYADFFLYAEMWFKFLLLSIFMLLLFLKTRVGGVYNV
jgi:hypothetical protein